MQNIEDYTIKDLKENIPKKLGMNIKRFRKVKKLTQSELALIIGKDRQYLYKIEKGKVSPTITTIALICVALEISLSELLNDVKLF
ncbi:MAG: helix-turn-helix domain-containing protein [Flavobacteriaceae bacterium]|jgi:transcriptional regulator with XRE-family HTH domain|nr:helix-turn-helix domain-containing protein [Flavobacteriaceae bacterium]